MMQTYALLWRGDAFNGKYKLMAIHESVHAYTWPAQRLCEFHDRCSIRSYKTIISKTNCMTYVDSYLLWVLDHVVLNNSISKPVRCPPLTNVFRAWDGRWRSDFVYTCTTLMLTVSLQSSKIRVLISTPLIIKSRYSNRSHIKIVSWKFYYT